MKLFKYLIKYALLFAIILASTQSYAQKTDELNYDKGAVNVRVSDKIEEFKNDSDFDYDETVKAPVSLWERFKHWLSGIIEAIFTDKGAMPYILKTVLFLALLAIIIKLLGLDYQTVFLRSRKLKSAVDFETYTEDIQGMNLDKLISESKTNGKYQLAVRYLYLKLLKQLSEKEVIEWEIEKTNLDYRKEVSKTEYNKKFQRLTFLYEYIWYGDFEIGLTKFEKTEGGFLELFKKLG